MQGNSPSYRMPSHICSTTVTRLFGTGTILAGLVWGAVGGASQALAQDEVGYVAAISGRVVALSAGTPILLNALDQLSDRTRVDVMANSELQICHHETQRIYTLKGPSRASVSAGSITIEFGKPVDVSKDPCAAPTVSKRQGGLLVRGVAADTEPSLRRNFLGK
jgi:hypothetical protein